MTERLRALIHISKYFLTLKIMEEMLSYKNEPKYCHRLTIERKRVDGQENSRTTWSSEQSLSSCKLQPCLFACPTCLPAPFRAVSTWESHSAINQTAAAAVKVTYVLPIRTQPKNLNVTPNSLYGNKPQVIIISVPGPDLYQL